MENAYKIRVRGQDWKWYDNAEIENPHDAVAVAKFYKESLGYDIRLIDPAGKDITQSLDRVHFVRVKKDDDKK